MKKSHAQINEEVVQSIDTFTNILGAGDVRVSTEDEQKVADALYTMGQNITISNSTINSHAYWTGVDALQENGQLGVLEKLTRKFEDNRPKGLKIPRSLMVYNIEEDGQKYFKTLPPLLGKIVFLSEQRMGNAYVQRFTEDRLNTARKKAEFASLHSAMTTDARPNQEEYVDKTSLFKSMNSDPSFIAAAVAADQFKHRLNSPRSFY